MPTLAQLLGQGSNPTVTTYIQNNQIQVEPLDGPTSVDTLLDRFPEEVYTQSRDSHLYKFLTALCGDSGAGLVKKQAYAVRLQLEAEYLNYAALDQFFSTYGFNRLPTEVYTQNPSDGLLPEQWEQIAIDDQSFKRRGQDFFRGTRYGNNPLGLALIAKSGSGVTTEVFEQYKYIYDVYSDDPVGIEPLGITLSISEYAIVPRVDGDNASSDSFYTRDFSETATFVKPTLSTSSRPAPFPSGGDAFTVTHGFSTDETSNFLPAIERNVVQLLDRLGPVGTLATFNYGEYDYQEVAVNSMVSSSSNIKVSRFVTGDSQVNWPATDPSQNYFIEPSTETEATYYTGGSVDLFPLFLTVDTIFAYTDKALSDPTYGTANFLTGTINSLAPVVTYDSEQVGNFNAVIQALFTFVTTVPPNTSFLSENALATPDTPLTLTGADI